MALGTTTASANFRVKTRLTGHGHNSNNGNYPHCCEWKNNTHYLYANTVLARSWTIWQQNDCADNPVFPQGGTWLGSREGWCPGDVVKETDVDVSSFVSAGQITLDYDITPVPISNLGMGGGNYVAQFHMVESGANSFATDAELYEVIAPNDYDLGMRKNPICYDPKIVIRNSGANPLTSLMITYNVSGGPQQSYTWIGNLKFMEKKEITLPITSSAFWNGDANHIFTAICSLPNGSVDQYAKNDTIRSHFDMPDVYNDNFHIFLRTNNRPSDNSWTIRDINNNVVRWANGFTANTTYRDTLNLPVGCYTFEFLDAQKDGLYYWAFTAQGTGSLSLKNNQTGTTIKQFEPEFGRRIFYTFSIGDFTSVENEVTTRDISIYPNPNTGEFTLNADGFSGDWNIEVINAIGQKIHSEKIFSTGTFEKRISLQVPSGVYFVNMSQGAERVQKKIVVE